MKQVIITGGSGQMGRAPAADLAKDGYEVILLSHTSFQVFDLPANVRAEKWDGRTAQGWGQNATVRGGRLIPDPHMHKLSKQLIGLK